MAEIEVVHAAADLRDVALEVFLEGREARALARLREQRRQAWRRALDLNPHAGADVPARVWLARLEGRPMGVLLGVPFRGRWGALALRGHWGVDLYVPDRYRGRGIGAALLTRWRDESPLALGLGITDSAFRIELSLGWQAVPLPARYVCPLTARGALLLKRAPLRRWRVPESPARAAGYEVRLTDGLDPGGEPLWRRLEPSMPAHIARDSAFLSWRYGGSEGGWQCLSLWLAGEARALCLFRIERTAIRRKAWIYELWGAPGEEAGRLLVLELLAAVGRQGGDLVEGRLTAPHLEPWLTGAGFASSPRQDRFIVHAGPELEAEALHRPPWYLTLADSGNL